MNMIEQALAQGVFKLCLAVIAVMVSLASPNTPEVVSTFIKPMENTKKASTPAYASSPTWHSIKAKKA